MTHIIIEKAVLWQLLTKLQYFFYK